MLDLGYLSQSENGHLLISGYDAIELTAEFGTPIYVMNEQTIRDTCREYKKAIDKHYNGKGLVIFASKAMCCKEICRIIESEGLGLDVVSGGELYTAIKAGFPANKIYFHGNNKSPEEIKMALEYGVGRIVIDSLDELDMINNFAQNKGVKVQVLLRIRPGVDTHTHDYIKTGQVDSKFGIPIDKGEGINAVAEIQRAKGIEFKGLHCHIGSQITELEPFLNAASIMMDFVKTIDNKLGIKVRELNLGGGYGIRYTEKDKKVDYTDYIGKVSERIKSKARELNVLVPYVSIEPGRSIVGESGITLYQVGSIKAIPGIRTYLSVDGGFTDNPRYALYKSEYTILNANKMNRIADQIVTIAGKCCESGDIIQENVKIQPTSVGDIIAVLCTGAYNYSMASNYNRIAKPAVVMIGKSGPRLIVRRQTLDEVIGQDM